MSKEGNDLAFEYDDVIEAIVEPGEGDTEKASPKEVTPAADEPQHSEAELKAMKGGWKPQEEWQGDTDDWVSAKEFNTRGELMSRITSQGDLIRSNQTELNDVRTALKALGEHNKKIAEVEYNKAVKVLKRQKVDALEEQDHETVLEIDDKLEELKDSKVAADSTDANSTKPVTEEQAAAEITLHPSIKAWMDDSVNDWYKTDSVRGAAADALAAEYITKNAGDVDGMIGYVDEMVRKRFPNDFTTESTTTRKSPPTTVTEMTGRAASKQKSNKTPTYTYKDLSEEQLRIARTYEADEVLSMQEYVDQLAEIGELPSQQG